MNIQNNNEIFAKILAQPSQEVQKVPTRVDGVITSSTEVVATFRLSHTSWKLISRLAKVMDFAESDALEMLLKQLSRSEPIYSRSIMSFTSYDKDNEDLKETVKTVVTAIAEMYERRADLKKSYKNQFVLAQYSVNGGGNG